ncbi:hypothetical protein IQ07DRAFT_515338, partial [Pyrenochaeta sp. DS3sAY3a]
LSTMAQPRTYALDNLRTYLTVLVILHHAVVPYGGIGSWYYTSPYHKHSIAAKKRSRKKFLLEKWKRLGVPTLMYSIFSAGLIAWDMKWRKGEVGWTAMPSDIWAGIKSCRGVRGPVWYCALLFIFDAAYTVIQPTHFATSRIQLPTPAPPDDAALIQPSAFEISPNNIELDNTLPAPKPPMPPLRTSAVLVPVLLSSTAAFFIRIAYPTGTTFSPLNLQPGYTPQYILYYTAGIHLQRLSLPLHTALSTHTLLSAAFLNLLSVALGFVAVKRALRQHIPFQDVPRMAAGGRNLAALTYALWNESTGLIISGLLLAAFNHVRLPWLAARWALWKRDVGMYSYAAFLVHPVVLVDVQSVVDGMGWRDAVGKGVAVGAVGVLGSWGVGGLIRGVVGLGGARGYV